MWIESCQDFCNGLLTIHSSRHMMYSLSHIEGITLDAVEDIYKVAGKASGIHLDWTGETHLFGRDQKLMVCLLE